MNKLCCGKRCVGYVTDLNVKIKENRFYSVNWRILVIDNINALNFKGLREKMNSQTSVKPYMERKDYFSLNLKLLAIPGLSPIGLNFVLFKKVYDLYHYAIVMFVFVCYPTAEIIGMARNLNDLDVFTKLMGFTLSHVMGAFKIWVWCYKRKEIDYIISLMEDGPMFKYDKLNTKTTIKKAIKVHRFVTWTFFILGTALPINASVVAWKTPAVYAINEIDNTTVFLRKLPYDTWFPFEGRVMPYYPFAFLYQVICVFMYATSITSLDTTFVGLIIHISNKIKILKMAIVTMHERCNESGASNLDGSIPDNKMRLMLKQFAVHHQTIISVTRNLDLIIRFVLLGQFFATTFILCTSLFLLSIYPVGGMKFVNEFVYLMAALFQFIIYCWFGNGITQQSAELLRSLYESNWLPANESAKRTLIIMMIRTHKPIKLNIGLFAPLTLQTFVTVLRGSYSYFAVLKQMDIGEL